MNRRSNSSSGIASGTGWPGPKTTPRPVRASVPVCNFIPKNHCRPFLVWCISGSRARSATGDNRHPAQVHEIAYSAIGGERVVQDGHSQPRAKDGACSRNVAAEQLSLGLAELGQGYVEALLGEAVVEEGQEMHRKRLGGAGERRNGLLLGAPLGQRRIPPDPATVQLAKTLTERGARRPAVALLTLRRSLFHRPPAEVEDLAGHGRAGIAEIAARLARLDEQERVRMGGAPIDHEAAFVLGQLAKGEQEGEVSVVEGAPDAQKVAPRRRPFEVDGAEREPERTLRAGHIVDDTASGARQILKGLEQDALFGRGSITPAGAVPATGAMPALPQSPDRHGARL